MKVYIASDHAGFDLKRKLKKYLEAKELPFEDLGPHELVPNDDYPDYALPLAKKVVENSENKGILLCGNGVGASIVANKVKGIRAALSWDPRHAATARADDDANVLNLPARFISEDQAKNVVRAFLETPFSGENRHTRRIRKISEMER